ncbi:MAG: tRNA 2-thiouridine synthesizing protein D [Alloalcanivorax sp.]|jgi:tRNA 2-thiouridine synthesizing protein D
MIKVSLLVTAGPQRPGALTALHTAQAVARSSHQLYRIFFYGDGVHLANRLACRGDVACDAQRGWQTLVAEHGWPASVCVGAALKRGISDSEEARRAGLNDVNGTLADGFTLVGLGDWVDALTQSDRVVHFD